MFDGILQFIVPLVVELTDPIIVGLANDPNELESCAVNVLGDKKLPTTVYEIYIDSF